MTEAEAKLVRVAKLFEVGREVIQHEDGLINHRITWFLVLQGFLLTAFVTGVGLFEKFADRLAYIYIGLGLTAIAVLGILCCFLVRVVTDQAYDHIHNIAEWWAKEEVSEGIRAKFPPIRGEGMGQGKPPDENKKGLRSWFEKIFYRKFGKNMDEIFGTHSFPVFVGGVWVTLVLLMWLGIATTSIVQTPDKGAVQGQHSSRLADKQGKQ